MARMKEITGKSLAFMEVSTYSLDISIDPAQMQSLSTMNAQPYFSELSSQLGALAAEARDAGGLSLMTCTEMPVTNVNDSKYAKSQIEALEWGYVQQTLFNEANMIRKLANEMEECRQLLQQASSIMLRTKNYLSETASDFIEAEEQIAINAHSIG